MIVLNFHGIGDPHQDVVADEVPYWLSRSAFADLVARIAGRPDRANFIFTFDDGNSSDLYAAELLAKQGFDARFFILTGRFGNDEYLSQGDVRSLREMGMTIGLHGRDHVDWRKLDEAGLTAETVHARAELAEALGDEVREVAIPFGTYDRRVMGWLKAQGFDHIHTSDPGKIRSVDARVWNRNTLRCDMDEARIEAILDGRQTLAKTVRRALSRFIRQ